MLGLLQTLEKLDLSGNRIRKDGCAVLGNLFGFVDLKNLGKISQKSSKAVDSSRTLQSESSRHFIGAKKASSRDVVGDPSTTGQSLSKSASINFASEYPAAINISTSANENPALVKQSSSKKVVLDIGVPGSPIEPPSEPCDDLLNQGFSINLIYNTSITDLNISGNRIGAGGAAYLAKGLSENSTLRYLDVGYQKKGYKIGPEGAHKFADWLGSPTCKLLTFRCARNNIGFEGCRHISSALFRNTHLRELDIGGVNYITIAGALQLGQAIKCNKASHLTWLTVGEHRIPINPLIGRNSYRSSMGLQLVSASFVASSSFILGSGDGDGKEDDIPVESPTVAHESENDLPLGSPTSDTPLTAEFKGDIHAVRIRRIQSEVVQQQRDKAFLATTRHGMDDELGVVVATLVTHNRTLEALQIDDAKLPIQQLIGNDPVDYLDMSSMKLNSIDTIVIGSLIAENRSLKKINLRDNCFAATEGENFVAYALERNVGLKLDLDSWSAAQMYSDGYPTLAAVHGLSASGVTIEPQRLEGCFYQSLTVISAVMFYVGVFSDIQTIYQFASNPEIYYPGWVILLAVIMCIPTMVYLWNTFTSLICTDPAKAFWASGLVLFQLLPAILAYQAVRASMESAPQLDLKFVLATHKSIPQIYFQSFIMFSVGISKGIVNYWSLLSNLTSLLSITVIFIMLFDRKAARRMSMAPLSDQPQCAVVVAKIFEVFGMGTTSEEVKAFVNFDAFYTAHYCLSYVYQLVGLTPRIVAISWLLATEDSIYGVIAIGSSFVVRILVLLLHDAETYRRSIFNNIVTAISLLISDSAWHFDPGNPESSLDSFLTVSYLSSVEVIMVLLYCFCMFQGSKIPDQINITIFVTTLFGIFLRWLTLYGWAIRIHFPEFYVNRQRRGSIFVATDQSGQSSFVFGWNPLKQLPRAHSHKF
jgi:hypothetical protein